MIRKFAFLGAAVCALIAVPASAQSGSKAGDYGEVDTDYLKPLGMVQDAWNNPVANKAANQETPGYSRFEYVPDKIIPLRLREAMNTTIRFPDNETIEDIYVSDPVSFEGIIPRSNVVLLRVKQPGADGNVVAMGSSGNLYQFYIRGEAANTNTITDMSVDIMVTGRNRAGVVNPSAPMNMAGAPRSASASDLKVEADWLRSIGFRPENIVHDLSIYVPQDHSAGVAPERVFRDNQYTYIDYGANADAINEWPVASLVVQGVETPVNVRTAGPNGRMLVVEAVGNIVLRNGLKIVCIKQNQSQYQTADLTRGPALVTPVANVEVKNGQPVLPPSLNSPSTGRKYEVDLGSGDRSTMEALWLTLKAQNSTVLGPVDPSYPSATSLRTGGTIDPNANPGDVRLRAGPFYGLTEGVRVCKEMTASGRSCAVIASN